MNDLSDQEVDDVRRFVRAVTAMRTAQKSYFKTRNTIDLQHAKAMEQNVDKYSRSLPTFLTQEPA